jgi:uncharacterized protein YlxW (UPF0749 family)
MPRPSGGICSGLDPMTDNPPAVERSPTDTQSEPGELADTKPPGKKMNRGATSLIAVLLALLGFAIAVQLRSNSANDGLSGAREDDLVRILDDQNSRLDRLQQQLTSLQATKQKLTDTGSNSAAALQEAQRQADALAILTGTVAAHGPGVVVTVTDPQHKLRAEDLLDVIEELRGAGAEVIQFGTVRVSTSTALTDSGSIVYADGIALADPYRVLAIGDPATMDTALNIAGGVVQTLKADGANTTVVQSQTVSITAIRPVSTPKYATQTPK